MQNYYFQTYTVYFMKLKMAMFMISVLKINARLILVDAQKILFIMIFQIKKYWEK